MNTTMKTMKGATMFLSDELSEAVHRRIFEKNMTMQEYVLDLIKQDLAMADSQTPAVETMYNENNELNDDVTDTDSTGRVELTEEDKQRLLDILYEVACMRHGDNEEDE